MPRVMSMGIVHTHSARERVRRSQADPQQGQHVPAITGSNTFCMPMCSSTETWQHSDQGLLDLLGCTVCSTEAGRHAAALQ